VLIIGRWYDPLTAGEQWRAGIDPKKAASDYVRMQERHYKEMPEILYWEGHNEPSFGAPQDVEARDGMRWYAGFEAERVRILADMGLRAVVGNFSTGYPEVENDNRLWEEFLPALEAAHEHKGFLGLHEYSGPFMWSGWGLSTQGPRMANVTRLILTMIQAGSPCVTERCTARFSHHERWVVCRL